MNIVHRDAAVVIASRHGSEIRPLIDRTTSDITQCSLAEEILPPGHAVVPHHHDETEEIYYIIEGSGRMQVGDEVAAVSAGDAVFIPRGSIHTLRNTGPTAMRIVLVCGPAFSRSDEHFAADAT